MSKNSRYNGAKASDSPGYHATSVPKDERDRIDAWLEKRGAKTQFSMWPKRRKKK